VKVVEFEMICSYKEVVVDLLLLVKVVRQDGVPVAVAATSKNFSSYIYSF